LYIFDFFIEVCVFCNFKNYINNWSILFQIYVYFFVNVCCSFVFWMYIIVIEISISNYLASDLISENKFLKSPSFYLLWSYLAISYSRRLSSIISIISNIFISSFEFIKSFIFFNVLSIKHGLWFNYIKLFTFTIFYAWSFCF